MRAMTELRLVEQANQALNSLHLRPGAMGSISPEDFGRALSVYKILADMNHRTLADIIMLALSFGKVTTFRKTGIERFPDGLAGNVSSWDVPKNKLIFLAKPVFLGAMFDIVATEKAILSENQFDSTQNIYHPPVRMAEYVKKRRLKSFV